MPANDRGPRGVATPGAAHTDAHRDDTAPVRRPEVERLGVSAWLGRLDELEDRGHVAFWRSLERLARFADFATGENARPALGTLAGRKVSVRAVRQHLRLAAAAGLLEATVRAGRPSVYALSWPSGRSHAEVIRALRDAGLGVDPGTPLPGSVLPATARVKTKSTPAPAASTPEPPCRGGPHPGSGVPPGTPLPPHPGTPLPGPRNPASADLLRPSRNQSSCCSGAGEGEPDQSYRVGPDKGPLDEPPDVRPWPQRDPEADLAAMLGRDPKPDELVALRSVLRVAQEQRAGDPRKRALVARLGQVLRSGKAVESPAGWAARVCRGMWVEQQDELLELLEAALRPKPSGGSTHWSERPLSRIEAQDRAEHLEALCARTRAEGEEPDPRTLDELAACRAVLARHQAAGAK